MPDTTPKLESSIRKHLAPLLRGEGFSGSGRTFRRVDQWAVHLVNVQGFFYGGRFAVNLAVHPLALPDTANNAADAKRIKEEHCEFRTRLTESAAGRTWDHDGTVQGMDAATLDAAEVYRNNAARFFSLFTSQDSVFHRFDTASLKACTPDLKRYCLGSQARVAFVMARLRKTQERLAEARDFAAYGLSLVNPGFAGYQELQEIADDASGLLPVRNQAV